MPKGSNTEKEKQGFQPTIPSKPTVPTPSTMSQKHSIKSKIGENSIPSIIHIKLKLDTSRPFVQANSLAKLATVVDAVSGSADTDESIAIAIGVVTRQGSYYANAAAYLGFLQEGGGSPRTWNLTAQGIYFLNSNASERVRILTELFSKIPSATSVIDDTGTAENEIANSESLSDSTASRRVKTLNSWIEILTSTKAIDKMTLEQDSVRNRIPEAAQNAAEVRARIKINRGESIELVICSVCYMAKSVNGICNCD